MCKLLCIKISFKKSVFNPIPAGVLENQDTLGGGSNCPPPPLNPMFDVLNITNDTSLESSCALL